MTKVFLLSRQVLSKADELSRTGRQVFPFLGFAWTNSVLCQPPSSRVISECSLNFTKYPFALWILLLYELKHVDVIFFAGRKQEWSRLSTKVWWCCRVKYFCNSKCLEYSSIFLISGCNGINSYKGFVLPYIKSKVW